MKKKTINLILGMLGIFLGALTILGSIFIYMLEKEINVGYVPLIFLISTFISGFIILIKGVSKIVEIW